MTRDEDARARLLDLIEDLTEGDDPLALVVTARILKEQLTAVLQAVVDRSRLRGASWQDVATALALKSPSSAFFHYGHGKPDGDAAPPTKEDRLEAQRAQAARSRKPSQTAPERPGLTRAEAAMRLSCDPKTVARRARDLDGVRAEEFTARSGKAVRRYFIL